MAFLRYWYHPESDSLWTSRKDELENSDGFVEELTYAEYEKITKQRNQNMPMNYQFDANQHQPIQGVGEGHPKGKFPATITNTSIEPTKDGTGGMFVVEFNTSGGSIKNRYNLWNANAKAVEIAHRELSALCYATGVIRLDMNNDGAALRNARLQIEVDDQKDKEGKPNGYVEVKKVLDPNGNEPGKAPANQPQPQGQQGGWGGAAQQAAVQQQQPPMQSNPSGGWQAPPAQSTPPAAPPAQSGGGWPNSQTASVPAAAPPWGTK